MDPKSDECITTVSVEVTLPEAHQCSDMNTYEGAAYDLLAHATVGYMSSGEFINTETGWTEGEQLNTKGSWASKSNLVLVCDCREDGVADATLPGSVSGGTDAGDSVIESSPTKSPVIQTPIDIYVPEEPEDFTVVGTGDHVDCMMQMSSSTDPASQCYALMAGQRKYSIQQGHHIYHNFLTYCYRHGGWNRLRRTTESLPRSRQVCCHIQLDNARTVPS